MNAEFNKIAQSIKLKQFAPVYLIDGEEPYYLDLLTSYFENNILQPHEKDFNLLTLYGREVTWPDVVNACRRFPMFAERQVVILKDAGQLKDLNDLMAYVEKPSPTTVLLLEYKFKKADGKTRIVKYIKDKGLYFNSEKVRDDAMPKWIMNYGTEIGFTIPEREAQTLATYLGNDLQKIANEIEKVRINVPDEKELTSALIQKYIGISREYNVFEFADVLTSGDMDKFYRMLSFFMASSKAAPVPLVIGTLYSHFSKLYIAHWQRGKGEKEAAAAIGIPPFRLRHTMATLNNWPLPRVERALLILGRYSKMSVGVGSNTGDRELLKEMMAQLIM